MNVVELREEYINRGYVIVDSIASQEEINSLLQVSDEIKKNWLNSKDGSSNNIHCIVQPHTLNEELVSVMRSETIKTIVSNLVGAHIPFWDGSVKAFHSMLFYKPPGCHGHAWHQDEIYMPTRDRSLMGMWVALDCATIENGCLWVVPESQRDGYIYPQNKNSISDEYDISPESFGFDETQAVPIELPQGSAVFFNGYLLHRSLKNRSNNFRRSFVVHYMNAWSLLPWAESPQKLAKMILPELLIDDATIDSANTDQRIGLIDNRNIIAVSGIDPYKWKEDSKWSPSTYLRP